MVLRSSGDAGLQRTTGGRRSGCRAASRLQRPACRRTGTAAVLALGACLAYTAGALSFAGTARSRQLPPVPSKHRRKDLGVESTGRCGPPRPRCAGSEVTLQALDSAAVASFAGFSVLTGAPIPLVFSALFRRAEAVEDERGRAAPAASQQVPAAGTSELEAEPRDLMWAFPSFAVFLERSGESAPQDFPTWARWLCLATFWPGLVWYLYYKIVVEEDLRQYRGLGIGGYVVIVPFALGLAAGIFGEVACGALDGGLLDNGYSIAFYAAFAWIYLNQWFLYNKVNQLFEAEGRPAPLDPWGLLVPGWNFVTGIRQIHFLAEYWARQRGQELQRDAFAELFPFTRKPTLSFFELVTTPSLWIDLGRLIG